MHLNFANIVKNKNGMIKYMGNNPYTYVYDNAAYTLKGHEGYDRSQARVERCRGRVYYQSV